MPGMALLFDNDDPDASQGFKNLKAAAEDSTGGKISLGLEKLWNRFGPYADKQFIKEFGRHVEERFWEMYLGVRLLEGRKALRKKDKLPKAERDEGPDFCIQKGRRRIWVEAIAPSPGDETNLDKVSSSSDRSLSVIYPNSSLPKLGVLRAAKRRRKES
jgi:hypothetical protein